MAGLLYFFPELSSIDSATAQAAGVPFAAIHACGIAGGPNGKRGVVVAAEGTKKVGYYPAEQEWARKAGLWLGLYKAARPSPDDLARPVSAGGHPVELADGNTWIVPPAQALPQAFDLDDAGELVAAPTGRYADLAAKAGRIWDAFVAASDAQTPVELSTREALEIAADALAVNYYVGFRDVMFLRLLDTANVREVLRALVDLPAIEEAYKKKLAADTSDSPAGPPA